MFYNRYKSKLNCNKMSYFRGVFMVIIVGFVYAIGYSSLFKKNFVNIKHFQILRVIYSNTLMLLIL